MPAFNAERAATILVEAISLGDPKAAEKYDVTVRSIQRWRKRMDESEVFSAFVAKKREAWEKGWIQDVPPAIRAAIAYLTSVCQTESLKDSNNPEVMREVNNMLKTLAEIEMSKAMIDARISKQN